MELAEQTLVKQQVLLKKDPQVHFLGRGLVLQDCEIISWCAQRGLHVGEATLIRGSFETRVTLANLQWCRAKLDGVRFIGHFSGCDFGKWPQFHGEHGDIRECDFTGADVDNCRFLNCNVDGLKFPGWPWFTLRSPRAHARELRALQLPGQWSLMMGIYADSPEECSAAVGNAQRLVEQFGGTLAEVRAGLQKVPAISF